MGRIAGSKVSGCIVPPRFPAMSNARAALSVRAYKSARLAVERLVSDAMQARRNSIEGERGAPRWNLPSDYLKEVRRHSGYHPAKGR